jgi:long-chain acyl-CoA synthetase
VGAYVKPKDGLTLSEKDIIGICRKQLPFAKSPKVVVFGDHLPVTSTGKYQRNKCKHLFAEWKSVQFNEKKGN